MVTEFPRILAHEQHIILFKFQNHGGIDCNPVACFCLRIFKNMHVRLWVNGFEILAQELQWLLYYTNSTLILWSQPMDQLKQYSEDIPEVGLEIVLKSAEIEDLVTKLGASTERERERTVTISLLNNSTYFVCYLTFIYNRYSYCSFQIYHKSPSYYIKLQQLLCLQSTRMLQDVSSSLQVGDNSNCVTFLQGKADMLKPSEPLINIQLDEMYVKPKLQ